MGAALKLVDLAAVPKESDQVLGHIMWFYITETQVKRDELTRNLLTCGLGKEWLPPEIRTPDAFRKATKAVETRIQTGDTKIHENYLVREVSSDKNHVRRNIVKEVVDAKGRKLDYVPDEAILELNKKTGRVDHQVNNNSITATAMIHKAMELYEMYKAHHDARAIRAMVYNLLRIMAPTPVRPSGGVYFIPVSHRLELQQLIQFLSNLPGGTEGYMIPVIDSTENRDMIRRKLNDYLMDTLLSLKNGLSNPKMDKSNATLLLEEAKRRLQDFKEYQKVLQDEMTDMEDLQGFIRAQMFKLLEKDF